MSNDVHAVIVANERQITNYLKGWLQDLYQVLQDKHLQAICQKQVASDDGDEEPQEKLQATDEEDSGPLTFANVKGMLELNSNQYEYERFVGRWWISYRTLFEREIANQLFGLFERSDLTDTDDFVILQWEQGYLESFEDLKIDELISDVAQA